MKTVTVKDKFAAMGAEVRFGDMPTSHWSGRVSRARVVDTRPPFTLDIKTENGGQFFEILIRPDRPADLSFEVLDIAPDDRHLLLAARWFDEGKQILDRFLCGHDERFWFAAAVPGNPTSVPAAKEALKPDIVRASQAQNRVKPKNRHRRKNAGFLRQGEWFFVPAPDLQVPELLILRKEPLRRGRGKPHMAEFVYRHGGTSVYVCHQYPRGLTVAEYRDLIQRDPDKKNLAWSQMARDPEAYAKGRIVHPDHKTIVLPFWHRVVPNRESESRSGSLSLVFLD